ncbi:MAG: sigma-70 family RNA polymerase sigma factor [Gemmataceae bacterium]|nr:sigma-70 family RNA polymerase sigma factor [Gemmataceae bacterium]
MPSESEKLLIKQIRTGDEKAWKQLIKAYEGRLMAFAIKKLQDRTVAEDVVQETFVGFLNSLPNFDERRELQTYLFTIANYKIMDHLRRTIRKPSQNGEESAEFIAEKIDDRQRHASSVARSKEQIELEVSALARALRGILKQLQEKGEYGRIQTLELLFVKGMANKDVARELKISEQQVANIRFAAIRKLGESVREAGLPIEVFPELAEDQTT